MPSYMTIVVIALAASNVSAALPVSVPVHSSREVREQSLSRRDLTDPPPNTPPPGYRPPNTPPPGYPPPGYRPPGYPPQEPETKPMLPGNTVPSDREQLGPPPTDVPPPRGSNAKPLHIKIKVNTAPTPKKTFMPPKGSNARQYLTNFLVGTAATMTGATILKWITGSSGFSSSAPSSSANQNSQSNSYPPPASYTSSSTPSGQYGSGVGAVGPGQYQNQQRDVDHGKRAGSFEAEERSNFDNDRRATSHLELLTRAELGEAVGLFTRVLDELD